LKYSVDGLEQCFFGQRCPFLFGQHLQERMHT